MLHKFRTPTRCQNGHFRWYYFEVRFGRCFNIEWSDKPCKCSTHEIGEGFDQCGEDQMFTGLKDRNGKDVYEGDVVLHHKYGGTHLVKWTTESTGFFVGELAWPLSLLCVPNIEVVSHIYEESADVQPAT